MCDTEPSVQAAFDDVRDDASPTNWALFSYTTPQQKAITLKSKGSGGFGELKAALSGAEVLYGYFRVTAGDEMSKRTKFVFLSFVGSEVSPFARARVSTHKPLVAAVLRGAAVSIEASSAAELVEAEVLDRVRKAGGANYDGQAGSPSVARAAASGSPKPGGGSGSGSPKPRAPPAAGAAPAAAAPAAAAPASSKTAEPAPESAAAATATTAAPAASSTTGGSGLRVVIGQGNTQGRRPTMEDCHDYTPSLEHHPHVAMLGVYDGHGGVLAAEFTEQNLRVNIEAALTAVDEHGGHEKALVHAFLKTDRDWLALADERADPYDNEWECGSTVNVALLDGAANTIMVANLGDARCVLARGATALALSRDHKPNDPVEVARVQAAGSYVAHGRVGGTTAITRAIGDREFKNFSGVAHEDQAISPKPEIRIEPLQSDDRFVVVACDGLWDVKQNQAVVDWVSEQLAARPAEDGPLDEAAVSKIAQQLAEHAVSVGSTDNVSVLIGVLHRDA